MSESRSVRTTYQAIIGGNGASFCHHSPLLESREAAEKWIMNEAEMNGEYRIEKRYELVGAKSFGQWLRGFGK